MITDMQNKKCNICHITKPISDFHISRCNKTDGRYSYCKNCKRNKYLKNRETVLKRSKKWREDNHDIYIADQKRRYLVNSDHRKATSMAYYEANKKSLNEWAKGYMKDKKSKNVQFKIACNLRAALNNYINGKGYSKINNNLFGCSNLELRAYIQSKFKEGMNWENRGKGRGLWQIDHIKPYSNFDLTIKEDVLSCCHFSNLQPMWWIDNIRKGNK